MYMKKKLGCGSQRILGVVMFCNRLPIQRQRDELFREGGREIPLFRALVTLELDTYSNSRPIVCK